MLTLALSAVVGCTTHLPPLAADNPASLAAPEAVTQPARFSLGTDSATKRTGQLIAARAQRDSGTQPQQEKKDQKMPGIENMPGMQHDR
jgi:hypothetical protein